MANNGWSTAITGVCHGFVKSVTFLMTSSECFRMQLQHSQETVAILIVTPQSDPQGKSETVL